MVTATAAKNGASAEPVTSRRDTRASKVSAVKTEQSSKSNTGWMHVRIHCVGRTPLLMDPMTDGTIEELETGVRKPINKQLTRYQVCEPKVMHNAAGLIAVPIDNFFACTVEAGRRIPFQKMSKMSTATSTTLPEYFRFISEDLVLLDNKGKPLPDWDGKSKNGSWSVDVRRGCLKDGTAVPIRRPKLDHWEFDVEFEYDMGVISDQKLLDLIKIAGTTMGLCSFRPNKKGRFGTFAMTRWEEIARREQDTEVEIVRLKAA